MPLLFDKGDVDNSGINAVCTLNRAYSGGCGNLVYNSQYQSGLSIGEIVKKTVHISGETPDFHSRLAAHQLIPFTERKVETTACSNVPVASYGICIGSPAYRKWADQYIGSVATLNQVALADATPIEQPDLDYLLQAAWAEAQSEGFDIATELAEMPETLKMFYGVFKATRRRAFHIRDRVKQTRKVRRKAVSFEQRKREFLKAFDDHWMEVRYGWRPLVYSSQGLVDYLEGKRNAPKYQDVKVRKTQSFTGASSAVPLWKFSWHAPYCGTSNSVVIQSPVRNHKVTGRAVVYGRIIIEAISWTSSGSGLSINPLTTAWEKVPYSFVADWFVNINQIAAAHWPSVKFSSVTACTSITTEDWGGFSYRTPVPITSGSYHWADGGRFDFSVRSYHRTPRSDIPWNISFRPRISLEKMKDMQVLMKNLRNKLFK